MKFGNDLVRRVALGESVGARRGIAPRALLLGVALLAGCSASENKRQNGTDTNGAQGSDGDGSGDGTGNGHGGNGSMFPNRVDGGVYHGEPIDDCGPSNPAGLTPEQVKALKAGGSTNGMRWLYPYDGTVFPRGLKSPLLMWDKAQADAVYVHIVSSSFAYEGCLKPSAQGRVELPQGIWEQVGEATGGAADPFTVELTALSGQSVQGPISEKIVVAQATVTGSIFYNSYNSGASSGGGTGGIPGFPGLPGGGGGGFPGFPGGGGIGGFNGTGAVLRIKPGKDAEEFVRQGSCTGCHSVSANGTRLVARELLTGTSDGQVYSITPDTAPNPAPSRAVSSGSAFVGLSPDGSVYIASGAKNGVGPLLNGGTGVAPDANATMYETDSGSTVSNTGIPATAMMPTFSADGTRLAFNDYAVGSGHALVVMDYDGKARKASNARTVYTNDSLFAGWPFVLPDNGALIFALGDSRVFDGNGVGINSSIGRGPNSDLSLVDIKSGKATILAQAMGFHTPEDAAANKTYLPFGDDDLHQVYYPTVTPVASGGYFWVFFDSLRNYGNLGRKRQLWGTAVTVSADGTYTSDPSHPAFYLSGQELESANHRAFTALDPCLSNGKSCGTGADCCTGICLDYECSEPKGCANTGGACDSDGDCCNPDEICINHFCSTIIVK